MKIRYVGRDLELTIPPGNVIFDIQPKDEPPAADWLQTLLEALSSPIGTPSLEQLVHPGQNVTLIVDDNTRPTPVNQILPVLLNQLNRLGIPSSNIQAVIASGTHRAMTESEKLEKYGRPLLNRIRFLDHHYKDPASLVDYGTTRKGTRILVNKDVVQADFRIAIGNIIPHHPAGWSGGAKAVLPGVGGAETVAQMHFLGSRYPALGKNSDMATKPTIDSSFGFPKLNNFLISPGYYPAMPDSNPDFDDMLTLKGTFYTTENKVFKNKTAVLIIEDKQQKQVFKTITDENGKFNLPDLIYFDTASLYYQSAHNSVERKKLSLTLDNSFSLNKIVPLENIHAYLCNSGGVKVTGAPLKRATDSMADNIAASEKAKTLSEVIILSKLIEAKSPKQVFAEKYISPNFNFTPALNVEFDFLSKPQDNISHQNIIDFIVGRIPGIKVDQKSVVRIYGATTPSIDGKPVPVQVYVDEIEMDPYELLYLRINDCALIRFYGPSWNPRISGPSAGTLIIYRKRGDWFVQPSQQNLSKLKIVGYNNTETVLPASTVPSNYQSLFWESNCSFPATKTIAADLTIPAGQWVAEIKIFGINNYKIPFTFHTKIALK